MNGNDQRKAQALTRKIIKQDRWRRRVMAETELAIRTLQNELLDLGTDMIELSEMPEWGMLDNTELREHIQ